MYLSCSVSVSFSFIVFSFKSRQFIEHCHLLWLNMGDKGFLIISSKNINEFVHLFAKSEEFKVRTDLFNETDLLSFFDSVTLSANVKFHHYNKMSNVQRYVYAETFVCHHSGKKKRQDDLK